MKRSLSIALGIAAGASSTASGAMVLDVWAGHGIGMAALLHLASVALCLGAARVRTSARAVETDAVLIVCAFIPVVGPALAWTFPHIRHEDAVEGAHAVFEAYERSTTSDKPTYRPPIFTGDFDRDLSRELNTLSYAQVLRRGTTEQKRNLLRSLGRRAEPRHLAMIRQCLLDEDHEIRLCAYAEIDRLCRQHETAIAELKALVAQAKPTDEVDDPPTALAQAQLDFAVSGILDIEMARFWMREAIKQAEQVIAAGRESWRAVLVKARAHAELEEFVEARAGLSSLSPTDGERPEALLATAEVAFKQRDFATARAQAAKLRHLRLQVPAWLSGLGDGTVARADAIWGDGASAKPAASAAPEPARLGSAADRGAAARTAKAIWDDAPPPGIVAAAALPAATEPAAAGAALDRGARRTAASIWDDDLAPEDAAGARSAASTTGGGDPIAAAAAARGRRTAASIWDDDLGPEDAAGVRSAGSTTGTAGPVSAAAAAGARCTAASIWDADLGPDDAAGARSAGSTTGTADPVAAAAAGGARPTAASIWEEDLGRDDAAGARSGGSPAGTADPVAAAAAAGARRTAASIWEEDLGRDDAAGARSAGSTTGGGDPVSAAAAVGARRTAASIWDADLGPDNAAGARSAGSAAGAADPVAAAAAAGARPTAASIWEEDLGRDNAAGARSTGSTTGAGDAISATAAAIWGESGGAESEGGQPSMSPAAAAKDLLSRTAALIWGDLPAPSSAPAGGDAAVAPACRGGDSEDQEPPPTGGTARDQTDQEEEP